MMKKILVVDDEPDFATIVQAQLRQAGYSVDVAFDGDQALRMMKKKVPDAVILDVMMPGTDGWTVCKKMKANKKLENVAVIMLTAVADHVTNTRFSHFDGMNTEADDYLPKPASAQEILDSLKSLL